MVLVIEGFAVLHEITGHAVCIVADSRGVSD